MIRACGWSAAFWCSVVSRRNASTTLASNWPPAWRVSSSRAASTPIDGWLGPVGCHGVEGVADGDDARAEGDVFAGEPIWVSVAVDSLVAGAD